MSKAHIFTPIKSQETIDHECRSTFERAAFGFGEKIVGPLIERAAPLVNRVLGR